MKILLDSNLWISLMIGKRLSSLAHLLCCHDVEVYICEEQSLLPLPISTCRNGQRHTLCLQTRRVALTNNLCRVEKHPISRHVLRRLEKAFTTFCVVSRGLESSVLSSVIRCWQRVFVNGGVGCDGVAAVGTDGEEEGAGHVAVGEADAGVEVEFAFLCVVEAQTVHDAVLLEVFAEQASEVGLGEAAAEERLTVFSDDEAEAVVFVLNAIFVNDFRQLVVGLAADGIDDSVAALHERVCVGIVGQAVYFVACLFCLGCLLCLSLLLSAGGEENKRIRE